nr:hypothetical protein Itr_chr10CG17100 [Ipomoea trifida]
MEKCRGEMVESREMWHALLFDSSWIYTPSFSITEKNLTSSLHDQDTTVRVQSET